MAWLRYRRLAPALRRMVRENRESREEATRAYRTMNEMAELLAAVIRDDEAAAANGDGRFVATAEGTMYHRPDCSIVAGRTDLRRVSAERMTTKSQAPTSFRRVST